MSVIHLIGAAVGLAQAAAAIARNDSFRAMAAAACSAYAEHAEQRAWEAKHEGLDTAEYLSEDGVLEEYFVETRQGKARPVAPVSHKRRVRTADEAVRRKLRTAIDEKASRAQRVGAQWSFLWDDQSQAYTLAFGQGLGRRVRYVDAYRGYAYIVETEAGEIFLINASSADKRSRDEIAFAAGRP